MENMKLLKEFDIKNYNRKLPIDKRESCRGIYIKNGLIAMLKSNKNYYKFPGGRIQANETLESTLIHEVLVECGLQIIKESIKPFGYIIEKRKSYLSNSIFVQYSYYFFIDILGEILDNHLMGYEIEEDFQLVFISIDEAINTNNILSNKDEFSFLTRENFILNLLKDIM